MRKLIVALMMLALLAAIAVATLQGSMSGDMFVSLGHLENTYAPQLQDALGEQIAAGTDATYQDAARQLDNVVGEYLQGNVGGMADYSTALRLSPAGREDTLAVAQGGTVLFAAGRARLESGRLLDLTGGALRESGADLTPGHRYLIAEDTAVITAVSELARMWVQGAYTMTKSGAEALPFVDVSTDDWFYAAVSQTHAAGLMSGVGEDRFGVSQSMTRAMLATVLHRMAGTAAAAADHGFTDVAAGAWYEGAVAWAVQTGVVQGMGEGIFAPEGAVTREQMAVMLRRYAGAQLALDVTATAALDSFTDGDKVSAWAEEGIGWAVSVGILTGRPDGSLDPTGTATRVEVATMLGRFTAWTAG